MTHDLRIVSEEARGGEFHMAEDERLFWNQVERRGPNPLLRFYRFREPAVTVGYGMWRELAGEKEIIRRPTGGGIVEHGEDLVYSLIAPAGPGSPLRNVRESYFQIHEALKQALAEFGVEAEMFGGCIEIASSALRPPRNDVIASEAKQSQCFSSPVLFDLMLDGRKIAGGAQKRSRGWLLHQGSIAWDVLTRLHPDLSERDFSECFANQIAQLFIEKGDRQEINACPLFPA